MVDGADLPVLLQELTSAFAANLASLPSFVAIIDEAGGAHIAVRGAFEVVVDGPEGPTSVAGGNVITWSEYRFRAHSGWRIATPVDGLAPEETPWQALSAVLPVSTLASGTVGEVGSAGASPIVSRVESEARPGLDEADVPVPSAAPIDEADPATSEPVHSPETEEDAQPLALASPASSQGEWADEALMVVEDDDSPAAAFFAAAAAPFFEEEPLGSDAPAPLADDESDEPDDPPSTSRNDWDAPAAEASAQAESTGEETQIPWYDREEEAEESSPGDDRVSSGDAQPDPEPDEEQALSPAIDAELGYAPGEQGSEDRVSPYEYLYDDVTRAGTVEDAAVRHVRNSDVIDDDPVPVPPPHPTAPSPVPRRRLSRNPPPLSPRPCPSRTFRSRSRPRNLNPRSTCPRAASSSTPSPGSPRTRTRPPRRRRARPTAASWRPQQTATTMG